MFNFLTGHGWLSLYFFVLAAIAAVGTDFYACLLYTSGIQSVLQDLGAKVVGQQLTIDLAADVLFDFDKYTLLPKANDTLRKVGQVAASYPSSPMLIEGHTDGKGTHPYNMKLSENRADACLLYTSKSPFLTEITPRFISSLA